MTAPTHEEMFRYGSRLVGSGLRQRQIAALEVGKVTQIPLSDSTPSAVRQTCSEIARSAGTPIRTRIIDGEVWVVLIGDEDA